MQRDPGARLTKRDLIDKTATAVITLGGVAVIFSIIAIMFFIIYEVYPLWKSPKSELTGRIDHTSGHVLATGVEEYREVAYVITGKASVDFISLKGGNVLKRVPLDKLAGKEIASVTSLQGNEHYSIGTADGYVVPVRVRVESSFDAHGKRVLEPTVTEGEPEMIASASIKQAVAVTSEDDTGAVAAITATGQVLITLRKQKRSLLDEGTTETFKHDLTADLKGDAPTAIIIDQRLENVYVGTRGGVLYNWDIREAAAAPVLMRVESARDTSEITALGFLVGQRSLIVGRSSGSVSVWFHVSDNKADGQKQLTNIHAFESHKAAVVMLVPTKRNRSFLSVDATGNVILHHSPTTRTLLRLNVGNVPLSAIAYAPRGDGVVAVNQRTAIMYGWDIDVAHPEVTLGTLFGKVWYEDYDRPEYSWQSSGSGDDFEAKLSLMPLIFGTLKGTLYAMLFAVPIAIGGAICVSQFMHHSLRAVIKPVIEIMAAMPSVVIGFVAGLWMAPLVERLVPTLFLLPVQVVVMALLTLLLWRLMPRSYRTKFRRGTEFLILLPVFVLGLPVFLWLNEVIQGLFVQVDFRLWLHSALGLTYDQRNSLIVGYAMSFAVIPIIFTIAEDAMSNVPQNLISASLALGANRWQTVTKVVLPAAAAGIFSAVMIGLSRAVGETMIVLMATGNTPIMDWSIFNGFRAMSANLAVEMPEAPQGGTLYRTLFLSALLLFFFTFVLNTAAEIIRMRIKRKLRQL
ncbi:ABC transporter permease subunit [Candidatus Magnetobacterium casense]|uniref:ABC transporter permease subunit n=1 Tax=Candidatus Magnetobacterium casense TaxID=1455061 RepID=A0ABS6RUX6_9BACT|nr:ABC transporter permease subunit [Candidatus Magnetobacterium casensis]MBV6340150.1 ABC transporter permease subunit [Candidatus Magnetobacterium casensis]